MLICRCDKCHGLWTFKAGEPLKCRFCGGEVYFLRAVKKI